MSADLARWADLMLTGTALTAATAREVAMGADPPTATPDACVQALRDGWQTAHTAPTPDTEGDPA